MVASTAARTLDGKTRGVTKRLPQPAFRMDSSMNGTARREPSYPLSAIAFIIQWARRSFVWRGNEKAPSPNLQAPEDGQIPRANSLLRLAENGDWCLEVDVSLVLGSWRLELRKA